MHDFSRLVKYSGLSFYLSPTSETTLKDWIDVKLKFNETDTVSDDHIPALLYWDTGNKRNIYSDISFLLVIKTCLSVSKQMNYRLSYSFYMK